MSEFKELEENEWYLNHLGIPTVCMAKENGRAWMRHWTDVSSFPASYGADGWTPLPGPPEPKIDDVYTIGDDVWMHAPDGEHYILGNKAEENGVTWAIVCAIYNSPLCADMTSLRYRFNRRVG